MTERSVHHQRRPPDVEEALSSMLWTPYERTPTDSSSEDDDVRLNSKLSKSQSNYDYHSMSALVPLSNSYFDANDLLLQPATSATAPALSTSTAALRPTPFVPFSSLIFDNPAIGNSCTNSLTDTSTTSTHFQKNNLSASNYRISYPYYGPIPSLNKFWSSASTIKEPPSYESLYSRSTTHTADSLKPVLNSLKSTVTTVSESQRQQFVCDKAERSQSERATPSRLVHSFTDNFISENSVPESQFSDVNFTSPNIETNKFAGLANTNGIATIFCDVAKEQSNNLSENLAESMNETNIRSQQNKENNNCIMNAIYCSNNNSINNNNSSDKNNHLIQHQQKHFANNQQNEEERDTINQVNQPVSSTAPLISRIKSSHKERKTHSTTQTTNSNCALFTNDSATSYSDNRLLCFPSVEVHVDGHNSTTISLSSSFNGSVCSTSSCSSRESYSNCENSNVFGYSAPIATNRSFDSGIVLHPNKCLAELERLYAEFRASESVIERKINELSLSEEKDKMRLNIPATVAVAEAKQTATTSSVFLTDTNSVTTNNGNCNSNSLSANNNNSCSNVAITTTNPCQRQSSLTIQVNNNLSNTHKNVENLSATSVQDRNFDHLINQSILNNNGISVVNCNYTQNTIASNNNSNSNGNNNNNNNNNNNFESVSHSGVNVGIGVGIGLGNSVAIISNPATNVNVNSCSNSVSNDVSNNSNNNCSSVPSNVFLSNVQSGSDYLNNNNNNNNVIVNNNNNKNQNNINKNAIIAKESVNIININNPVEAQTAVAAIATSVTSTSAATSQSPTISTRLPSTPSSPSRTFTSTECQTDDISSVQLRATERAAQPTTTSREQRRRERRERRHQQQQLQQTNVAMPIAHRRHNERHSMPAQPVPHLHPPHMHHAVPPTATMPAAMTAMLRPMLPDILHSHFPPPYSALPLGAGGSGGHPNGPNQTPLPQLVGPPPPQLIAGPPNAPPAGTTILTPVISTVPIPGATPIVGDGRFTLPLPIIRRSPSERSGKGCCGQWFAGPPLRALIAVVALGGVACALGGAALGATGLAGPPSSHLTAALLMIGVGVVLVTVSGAAWRMTAPGGPPCLGLGSSVDIGRCGRRPCSRGGGAPHGLLYPEFQHRPPPPSYQASMQEYRLRLLLLDRDRQHGVVRGSSPPPTYRSHAGSLLRAPLTTTLRSGGPSSIGGSEYSLPPSYRSRNTTPGTICSERSIETAPSGRLLANEDLPEPLSVEQLPNYNSIQSRRSVEPSSTTPQAPKTTALKSNSTITNSTHQLRTSAIVETNTEHIKAHETNSGVNQHTIPHNSEEHGKDLITIVTISQGSSQANGESCNQESAVEQIEILAHL